MTVKDNWKTYQFMQIADNVVDRVMPSSGDEGKYIGLEHMDTGSLHITRWGSETELIGEKLRIQKGDILFARRNAYLKRVAIAPFDGIFSAHGMVLRPKTDIIAEEFFPFFVLSDVFLDRAIQISVGSLSPTVNWGTLKKEAFSLPSIEDQQRIAKLLWAAEKQIISLEQVVENTRVLRNTYYAHTQNEKFFNENKKPYKLLSVEESYGIFNNLRKPISATERSTMQGKYPYYGPTGILDYINEYRVEGEYVLIGEDGDHFLKNEIWNMTQLIYGKNNVNNHAHILKGKNGNLTKWFYYYFKHRDIKSHLSKQGSGRLKLNKSTLQKMKLVIPQITTQEYLCNQYDEIEKALAGSINGLENAKNVLNSLIRFFLGGATNV